MRSFRQIKLKTPESVELNFTLAGIGSRILAITIDYLIIGVLIFTLLMILNVSLLDTEVANTLGQWIIAIQILVFGLAYFIYFIGFEVLWQGQTPGKRYIHIRVIQTNGRVVGLQQVVLRTLTRVIDDLFYLGLFLIIFNDQERRLGDWVADTLVIRIDPPETDVQISISDFARGLASQLDSDVNWSRLTPDDFAYLRELLHRRPLLEPQARKRLESELQTYLQGKLQLEQLPGNPTTSSFLEAIYLAYQTHQPGLRR